MLRRHAVTRLLPNFGPSNRDRSMSKFATAEVTPAPPALPQSQANAGALPQA